MMDVIYGEEVEPAKTYAFFSHLKQCDGCDREFRELTETREMLSGWAGEDAIPDPAPMANSSLPLKRLNWWGWVQKAAAVILMVYGGISAGQAVGILPEKEARLPEEQLTRMINDIVVERQSEGWFVIGKALVSLKEDIDARDRQQTEVFYEDLSEMEERFMRVMEGGPLKTGAKTSQ